MLDLSCKKHNGAYHVATDRWQNISSLEVNEQNLVKLGKSCAEFLVHGVDVEGKQSGIDEELVELLAEQSHVPVTYAGGVASMVCPAVLSLYLRGHGHVKWLCSPGSSPTCQSMPDSSLT